MNRLGGTLELMSAQLEQLLLLKEHELGARIQYDPDPYVVRMEASDS